MTIKQLIEQLQTYSPDAEVRFAAPTHDRWGTLTAEAVTDVCARRTQWSDYHKRFTVPDSETDDYLEDSDEDVKTFVILR